jgi:hypothetical protein
VTARPTSIAVALVGALLLGGLAVGCGSSGGATEGAEGPPPVAKPEDFPKAKGRALDEIAKQVGQGGPILAPSAPYVEPGSNRFGFALFDRSRAQIGGAAAVIYVAPAGGGPAKGPFPARYESLEVKPQYESKTVAQDADSAKSLYVADVPFPRPGIYEALAIARLDNRLVATSALADPIQVVSRLKVPGVGDKAPVVHTATKAGVGGDLGKIDTRTPPDDMHDDDFADVAGRKPAIIVFATPQLCQSRVCGPVVDVAAQVKAEHPKDVTFIHQEIYKDNKIRQGCLPLRRPASECFQTPFVRFKLPSEPWMFAIDRRGKVVERIEGAYSVRELEHAVDLASR